MKKFDNVYQDAAWMRERLMEHMEEGERSAFDERLSETPELQAVYEQLQQKVGLRSTLEEYQKYSSEKAYRLFLSRVAPKKKPLKPDFAWRWWCVAAAVVLVVSISLFLLNDASSVQEERALIQPGISQAQLTLPDGRIIDVNKKEMDIVVDDVQITYKKGVLSYEPVPVVRREPTEGEKPAAVSNELVIPCGGENIVVLSDGTVAHLNAGSKLVYPVRFGGKRRMVHLDGEAYFEVTADEEHPFVVQTHFGDITVLGTAFNVNAYADAPACYTTLVRGKVEVSSSLSRSMTLCPGEQAVMSADGWSKRVVHLEEHVGWVNGTYIFNHRPLAEIMTMFERWYDVHTYYDSPDLRTITYSGSVKRYGTINSFLNALELTGDIRYKVKGRNILIYKNE